VKKRIGLGTWSWGNKLFWNYQSTNDDDLRETYDEALRRGLDLIDTADSYGTGNLQGRSEWLIGKFLLNTTSAKKKRIQVATKLAPYPWRIGNRGFNKPFLKSLERLNNKLDIVQLHWSTAKYNPWQELGLLNNLCDLKDEGFDFQIGLSNIGPKRLMKLINFLAKRDQHLKSVQIQFSLLAPDLGKQYQVKKICDENNIDLFAYSPLAFGILCIDPDKEQNKEKSFLPGLIIVGSYVELSTLQLNNLLEISKCEPIELDVFEFFKITSSENNKKQRNLFKNKFLKEIRFSFEKGKTPVLFTSRKFMSLDSSEIFNFYNLLASFIAELVADLKYEIGYLISKGGITTNMILSNGLKADYVYLEGQILTGISVVTYNLKNDEKLPIVTHPGNIGTKDSLVNIWKTFENKNNF